MTVQQAIERLQSFNLPDIPVIVYIGGSIVKLKPDDLTVRRGYVDVHGVPCPSFYTGAHVSPCLEILVEVRSWPDHP